MATLATSSQTCGRLRATLTLAKPSERRKNRPPAAIPWGKWSVYGNAMFLHHVLQSISAVLEEQI